MPDPIADFRRASRKFQADMAKAMAAATVQAANLVLGEMRQLTAAIGNSLEDLRRMGHPYKWVEPPAAPFADWIVHRQEGDLQGGLSRGQVVRSAERVEVQLHSGSEHTWYLLLGTRYMRPRDFVSAALIYQEEGVADIYRKAHSELHDEKVIDKRYRPAIFPLPHDEFPAELPERG